MDLDTMIKSFAKGEGDRIIEKVQTLEKALPQFVCPVYCESPGPCLSHIGSAILMQIGDSRLLLTAAHVLDHRSQGTLCIPGNNELIALNTTFYTTSIPQNGTRDDDKIDFGFCRLNQNTLKGNSIVSHSFLPVQDVIPDDKSVFGRLYTFVGYPNTKNKVRYSVKPAPYSFLNTPLSLDLYPSYGLHPSSHIAVKYDRKKSLRSDGKHVSFPDPYGLSGGGLWVWDILDRLTIGSPEVSPKLVGLTIGRTEDKKAWYATKIVLILECIRQIFPEMDALIPHAARVRVNVNLNL